MKKNHSFLRNQLSGLRSPPPMLPQETSHQSLLSSDPPLIFLKTTIGQDSRISLTWRCISCDVLTSDSCLLTDIAQLLLSLSGMRYHDSDSFYMAYGSLTLREVIHFFLMNLIHGLRMWLLEKSTCLQYKKPWVPSHLPKMVVYICNPST